ncbi:amidase signature domain-containing protein [Suillus clintonianus]|uniref:amidase signature domain-containing protein n=1 Tax=Suillus clintonianus TaxID=1904413 RepID=UPI001B87BB5B|nr:amidase signature domain-containing protein [Suillus clintonianus]KAG2148923.1 amidase signature domain-containing protein [Suillus clintonianus]
MATVSFKEKIKGVGGNALYEAKARVLREQLEAKFPASLRLPPAILEDPPLDVTHIPETCGLLTPQELAITELDATAVCQKIAAGELTAVEAVTAFGKRAAIAHQLTACLIDFFLDEGIKQAQQLDEYFRKEGKVVGPLHGLPISVKAHYPIKGTVGTGGFLVDIETSTRDCDMTSILRSLGAVFYVKTNQPQTIMHLESQSNYGRSLNPHNTNLTPGGSSGGESALVAMKGSCMGLGTDGGGSIRGPSAHCGIYGIRPSSRTTPTHGLLWYQPGQDGVIPSTGPMCRSARDMQLFLEAVLGANPALLDPDVLPIPLNVPDLTQKKLRVGIMMHDGVVMPHPPTIRALNLVKAKLEASSEVEVVDYIPYDHGRGYSIVHELYYEDGGATVRRLLEESGEDMHPLTEWVISPQLVKNHDAAQVWKLRNQRDKFRREYSDHWWSQNVDVVVCPPFQGTASLHDTTKYWGYTAIWNLLDYPGAVFPTGLVADPAVDIYQELPSPMSAEDEYNISLYDAAAYKGAPVSLQTVSRRFNDGLVLAAQGVIERILKS